MRPEQWQLFKAVAKGGAVARPPVALIVDSPWIPGYLGLGHMDYFFDAEAWFQANHRIAEEFPDAIFFPSWWAEFGMAIEPTAFGSRVCWHDDQPPSIAPSLPTLDSIPAIPDPQHDGLMPVALHRYHTMKRRIFDAGYTIPVVAARGPLCLASFLRGVTEFMMDLVENPEGAHRLLEVTTETVIAWLRAQAAVVGASVEGIFVLDDIVGMLSRTRYLEFAQPYLRRITDAFPPGWVKVYHNDANVRPFLAELSGAGFDVLNWSYDLDVSQAIEKTAGGMTLMGNVPPLDVGVRGTPSDVREAAAAVLAKAAGHPLILSFGGGVSMGTPGENVRALIEAGR
jgi:uroporphyrinogen-III decarboxylase